VSQENVERLRKAYETFGQEGLAWDLMAEDIEFRQPDELGGGEGTYSGREGVARGVQQLLEVFDEMHAAPERFIENGDCVVVFVRLRGRAKQSGVPIDEPFAHLFKFRGEQIVLWEAYSDRDAALRALDPARP